MARGLLERSSIMNTSPKSPLRPFGLRFLETVETEKLDQTTGGMRSPFQGPIFTTAAISRPVRIGRHHLGRPDHF